jgi:GT2 family glycosyltransferase
MANYNRRKLLINTLKTIEYYNQDRDIEVIVVDDNSDKVESVTDLPGLFKIPVITIPITKKEKKWTCCCMPFNIGFSFATGDIIIIQNPENLHVGDIVGYALRHLKKGIFLSYALLSLNHEDTNRVIDNTISKGIFEEMSVRHFIGKTPGRKESWKDGDTCWYNHSVYQPAANHLISAITRADLEDLHGFDERYGAGFAYDDFEFKIRLERKGMITKIVDDPFAIHQRHTLAAYDKNHKEANRNLVLLTSTQRELFYRAPNNVFYKPRMSQVKKKPGICPVSGKPCKNI